MLSSLVPRLTPWRPAVSGAAHPDPRHTFGEWMLRPGTASGKGPSAAEKNETKAIWKAVGGRLIELFKTVTDRCAGHTHTGAHSFMRAVLK
jgi:hypothetical protein